MKLTSQKQSNRQTKHHFDDGNLLWKKVEDLHLVNPLRERCPRGMYGQITITIEAEDQRLYHLTLSRAEMDEITHYWLLHRDNGEPLFPNLDKLAKVARLNGEY
jgi:hypothetical protein